MFSLDFLFLSSPLAEDSFGSHFAEGKRTTREPLIKISGSSFFCDCFCRTKKNLRFAFDGWSRRRKHNPPSAKRKIWVLLLFAVCIRRTEQKTQAQCAKRSNFFFGFFFFWRFAFAGWSRSCKHNARSAVNNFQVLLFSQFAFAE